MGYVDLHVHSNASDGTLSPEEVVRLAARSGLLAIALTDHDTTAGISCAVREGSLCGVEVIPGIEVSSSYKGHEIHILGLFVDQENPDLIRILEQFRRLRNDRNTEMLGRFAHEGIYLTQEELCGGNPQTVITRAHVARALWDRGLGSDMNQIFKKYLQYNGRYCPPKAYLPPEEVMEVLLHGGAFAALAHPFQYHLGDAGTRELIGYLAGLGMKGLEVYHSSHNQQDSMKLQKTAAEYGLLPTGGSDFHGSNKPDISIGKGRGGLRISSLLLDDIKKARSSSQNG